MCLFGSSPAKAEHCLALFQRAQRGEVVLVTNEAIVAEITFVLSSKATYRRPRAAIAATLRPLLAMPGLRIEHKPSVLDAIDAWETSNLDFEECLAIETVRRLGLDGIYSYDRGLDRMPGVRRLGP